MPSTTSIVFPTFLTYHDFVRGLKLSNIPSDSGIFVLDIRDISEEALEAYQHYRNEFYEINLSQNQREFVFTVDGVTYHPDGTPYVCFISPSQLQSFQVLGEDAQATGYCVYVKKEALHSLRIDTNALPFFKRSFESYYLLNRGQAQELMALLELMKLELQQVHALTDEILKSYLEVFLLKCWDYLGEVASVVASRPQEIVNTFMETVQEQVTRQRTVSFYVDKLAISRQHLNQLTQQVLGKTALQVIHEILLEKAKALLAQSSFTASEIAYQLGFEEPAHFSRFFKRLTNATPRQYQMQTQGNC
ncbi:MAG: helix-turn-helix domain-containing protein [Bacteroidota bacterium]